MSIYHLSIKIIGRRKGQSAIACASYRSGTRLKDLELNKTFDYKNKSGIVYSEIVLCQNAPASFNDRETLWNAVHQIENKSDSQLSREFEVALPVELDRGEQIQVTQEFVQTLVDEGMCVDFSIHDKMDGNPHAHIMATMRPIKENGEWGLKEKKGYALDKDGNKIPILDKDGNQKIGKNGRKMWKRETVAVNDWNQQSKAQEWRERWASICNQHLDQEHQIDNRSNAARGLETIPTIHEGYVARKIERDTGTSELGSINKSIRMQNALISQKNSLVRDFEENLRTIDGQLDGQLEEEIKKLPFDHEGLYRNGMNLEEFDRIKIMELSEMYENSINGISKRSQIESELIEQSKKTYQLVQNDINKNSKTILGTYSKKQRYEYYVSKRTEQLQSRLDELSKMSKAIETIKKEGREEYGTYSNLRRIVQEVSKFFEMVKEKALNLVNQMRQIEDSDIDKSFMNDIRSKKEKAIILTTIGTGIKELESSTESISIIDSINQMADAYSEAELSVNKMNRTQDQIIKKRIVTIDQRIKRAKEQAKEHKQQQSKNRKSKGRGL